MAKVKWSFGESYLQSKPQDKPRDIPQDRHIGLGITEHNPREDAEKRESLNSKLNERYLVKRGTQNPYFINQDYIKDMDTQSNFLIPQNSNIKEKEYC